MCGKTVYHYATGLTEQSSPCQQVRIKRDLVTNLVLAEESVPSSTDIFTMVLRAIGLEDSGSSGIDDLYPAVLECFAVILLGYIAGKVGIITPSESKGLNTFIGKFSLPALIFLSMARLDMKSVNWMFLLAICLAKAAVFFAVLLVSLLVSKPKKLDRAGLYAIFCTQSNDFALGYPIVRALYGKTHPQYADYLYLVAPVNLIILNPIAFVLMEIAKQKELENQDAQGRLAKSSVSVNIGSNSRSDNDKCAIARKVLKGIVANPIVLMTALGIIGNLVFSQCLPKILEGTLTVLGSAFSASALFSLGLTMVGSAASLKGSGFVVPGILIGVKLLVLPLVSREFVSLLQAGSTVNETVSLSNFAFLYGTFPTAPGVFVYATQYEVAVQMIAGAMVACTFISAPFMFVSAKMITLTKLNPKDYVGELDVFLFNMSVLGLVASFWVLMVFILSRKWTKVPHCITLCLVISQAIACVGAMLWSSIGVSGNKDWRLFLEFGVFAFGVYSSRIWTAILASSLVFLRCRSLCFVLKLRPYMGIIGWGIPAGLVTVLMITVQSESLREKQDPNFQYGQTQAMVALMVLVISFIVTIGCLIMQQRYERQYAQYSALYNPASPYGSEIDVESHNDDAESSYIRNSTTEICPQRSASISVSKGPQPCCSSTVRDNPAAGCCSTSVTKRNVSKPSLTCITEIEDLGKAAAAGSFKVPRARTLSSIASTTRDEDSITVVDSEPEDEEILFSYNDDLCSPSRQICSLGERKTCAKLLARYKLMNQLTEPAEIGIVRDRDDEFQMLRHIVLLLMLCSSMFVGIALCLWTLITEEVSGIYVELVFLDAALNFGQGFFTFMLFGLNTRRIIMPLNKWWRRLVYGEGAVPLPTWEDLSSDTKQICEQFLTYHIDKCIQDIVRDRRWRMESYSQVFCGHELVEWLLLVGLARDRSEAVKYGRHLLTGRVIRKKADMLVSSILFVFVSEILIELFVLCKRLEAYLRSHVKENLSKQVRYNTLAEA